MGLRTLHMTTLASAVLLASTAALADGADGAGLTRPPAGSIARQLRLKMTLHRITPGGSLVAALRHNRQEWESLTPDQRGHFRKSFLAFLHKSADEQENILTHYEKLFKMTTERRDAYRQRAKWLAVVVESFTPAERTAMQQMTPDDRARKLLARKALLIKQGRLKDEAPTTAPSTAPARRM